MVWPARTDDGGENFVEGRGPTLKRRACARATQQGRSQALATGRACKKRPLGGSGGCSPSPPPENLVHSK